MASLLDWDLEAQIYPVVRWLVYHRRAKIVDTLHPGLKTAFTVPSRFEQPCVFCLARCSLVNIAITRLSVLAAEFSKDFNHPAIPPLPRILATISSSMSKRTENHFYACFVKTKELITTFQDVIIWMLKRDLLITLHLRVRVVVPPDLKIRVRLRRERALAQKNAILCTGDRQSSRVHDELDPRELGGLTAFPILGLPWLTQQVNDFSGSNRTGLLIVDEHEDEKGDDDDDYEDEDGQESEESDMSGSTWDAEDDQRSLSIISDPARATPLQRRWLSTMSEGKDPYIAKQFEQ